MKCKLIAIFLLIMVQINAQEKSRVSYNEYIRENIPQKEEIDVFLGKNSWAKFDSEEGYILGNYMPNDGLDNSSTISTSKENGARTSFMYADKPCRINTYGDSFTQCHQVSDGETWQEYLAAHLGEPIRNFGMGGFGVYQAYRRMLREEKTANNAEYLIFYIWGDDHIRSLLRCRYMLMADWTRQQEQTEPVGKMFHGNFWSNVEMDLNTGKFTENNSRISQKSELYNMTNANWMVENLDGDLALQMYLFKQHKTDELDLPKLKKLAAILQLNINLDDKSKLDENITLLLDKYGFAATKFILQKAQEFATQNNKKLMVVLFDPYKVTKQLLAGEHRFDQDIVDFLLDNKYTYFDMNLVHVEDYKAFNLSGEDYYKRYFVGHYSPIGNHFFAFSIKDKVVEWLNPKPITYQNENQKMIQFNGYLEGVSKE